MNRRTPKQRHFTDFAPTNGRARFRLAVGVRRALPGAAARSVDSDAIAPDTEETDYAATVEHCTVCGCFLSVEVFQNARRATEAYSRISRHPFESLEQRALLSAAGEAKGRLPPAPWWAQCSRPENPNSAHCRQPQSSIVLARRCFQRAGWPCGLGRTSNRRRDASSVPSAGGCMPLRQWHSGQDYEVNPPTETIVNSFDTPTSIKTVNFQGLPSGQPVCFSWTAIAADAHALRTRSEPVKRLKCTWLATETPISPGWPTTMARSISASTTARRLWSGC